MRKVFLWIGILFIPYTLFWIDFFHAVPSQSILVQTRGQEVHSPKDVLAANSSIEPTPKPAPPSSYNIPLLPRRQVFNLSCEFAGASAIISYFTANPAFALANEETAEKTLIEKIGVSQNPNVGIRMGDILEGDYTLLFKNLNRRFGGTDYYGVHAPPFIDLFAAYGLIAKPIMREANIVSALKDGISSGHLVMAWIRIGFGQPVDVALTYGDVSIIRGEHTVVLEGYDENGFLLMDPGIGAKRYVPYANLLEASEPFPLPFLEVYPQSFILPGNISQPTQLIDKLIALPREKVSITVENGSGKIGKGTQMAAILGDFGYKVVALKNADNFHYEDVSMHMKKGVWDYKNLLEKDLELASYTIATIAADLSDDSKEDLVIIVGN